MFEASADCFHGTTSGTGNRSTLAIATEHCNIAVVNWSEAITKHEKERALYDIHRHRKAANGDTHAVVDKSKATLD